MLTARHVAVVDRRAVAAGPLRHRRSCATPRPTAPSPTPSTAAEVFRGLGYWFFYGTDSLGPWFKASRHLHAVTAGARLSFAVPVLAVVAALLTRFRYRIFFVGLVARRPRRVGRRAPVGLARRSTARLFKAFTDDRRRAGDALDAPGRAAARPRARGVPRGRRGRALPAGAPAWRRRSPAWPDVLIVRQPLAAVDGSDARPRTSSAPRTSPRTGTTRASSSTQGDRDTRVLEIPGIDFANYRWGATVDPITPGLTDRDLRRPASSCPRGRRRRPI